MTSNLAESLFEFSLRNYRDHLTWTKTYAATQSGYDSLGNVRTFYTEEGPPDYCVIIAPIGRACWVEIKSYRALNRHTERERLHQYDKMVEDLVSGALGFYMVLWRWKGKEEWRLYPVQELKKEDGAILFLRKNGRPVNCEAGWPDWFEALSHQEVL